MLYRLFTLLILLLAAPAWGGTRTVGTGQSYATIALALAAAEGGDTIEICADTEGGSKTYSEKNLTTILDNLIIQGRSGDTITWDGSGGEYCLMLSDGTGTPGAGNYPAADGVTIRNIIFTGTVQEFAVGTGWPYPGGANNTTITGCTFTGMTPSGGDAHGWGIVLAVLSDGFTFTNNTISNNVDSWGLLLWATDNFSVTDNTWTGGAYTYSACAPYVGDDQTINAGETDSGTISRNTFTGVNQTGTYKADGHLISINGGVDDSRPIKRVTIADNQFTASNAKGGTVLAVYNAENITVERNKIYSNYSFGGIGIGTNCSTVTVRNNIIAGNNGNTDQSAEHLTAIDVYQAAGGCATCTELTAINVFNNTIHNVDDSNSPTGDRDGIRVGVHNTEGFSITNIDVKNNIVSNVGASAAGVSFDLHTYLPDSPTISGLDFSNNIYFRSSNTDHSVKWHATEYSLAQFATYQTAQSQDANSLVTDPLLNAAYGIPGNSPAKDAGAVLYTYATHPGDFIGAKVYGAAPDIGAYEYQDHTFGGWFFEMFMPIVMKLCASTNAACYTQP